MEGSVKTKKLVICMVTITVVIIVLVVVAFVFFFQRQKDNVKEVVNTGVVLLSYKNEDNLFALPSLTPMPNEDGSNNRTDGSYFDFAVSSDFDSDSKVSYEVAIEKDESSTIPDENIMVFLEKETSGSYSKVDDPTVFTPRKKKSSLGSPKGSMVLDQEKLSSSQSVNYRLRIWVKEGSVISDPNSTYAVRVKVNGKAI